MFESLTAKLDGILAGLRGRGKLTEANIKDAMREIRLALLEADVNFQVVKDFVQRVQATAPASRRLCTPRYCINSEFLGGFKTFLSLLLDCAFQQSLDGVQLF